MFTVTVLKIFNIAGRASVVESPFSKVTGEISAFYSSAFYNYLLKSSSFRNFLKFPFHRSCSLVMYKLLCDTTKK